MVFLSFQRPYPLMQLRSCSLNAFCWEWPSDPLPGVGPWTSLSKGSNSWVLCRQLRILTFKSSAWSAGDNAGNCLLKSYWTHWLPSDCLSVVANIKCRLNPWRVWTMHKNERQMQRTFCCLKSLRSKCLLLWWCIWILYLDLSWH